MILWKALNKDRDTVTVIHEQPFTEYDVLPQFYGVTGKKPWHYRAYHATVHGRHGNGRVSQFAQLSRHISVPVTITIFL